MTEFLKEAADLEKDYAKRMDAMLQKYLNKQDKFMEKRLALMDEKEQEVSNAPAHSREKSPNTMARRKEVLLEQE